MNTVCVYNEECKTFSLRTFYELVEIVCRCLAENAAGVSYCQVGCVCSTVQELADYKFILPK